jgi:iron complex transport system substrate-binding protein
VGPGNIRRGCVENFDPSKDYFPEKTTLQYAKVFSVEYHRSYKVVTVRDASEGEPAEKYVLVQCGAPKPDLDADLALSPTIQIPITSLFVGSTTHHPLLVDLERVDLLTGMPKHNAATMQEIVERVKTGKVVEYGEEGATNAERVILESPSMLMVSNPGSPTYAAVRAGGVPVVANSEWLEDSALGRSEWVKYLALFLNEEAKAGQVFKAMFERYEEMARRTRAIPKKDRPKVMTGGVFRGTFSMAGGRSYVAKLIDDAGGDYLWSDDTDTGYSSVDFERAIVRSSNADYWINGGPWKSLAAMLNDDPRYKEFKAFRTGQVWLYERKKNAAGRNDYWAKGITRPDLILADLVKIFHPNLAEDHQFEWYQQVPAS